MVCRQGIVVDQELGGGGVMSMGAYGRYAWLWGHMIAWT